MRSEVAARIAQIRAERASREEVSAASVLAALIRMAKSGEELKTAAAIKEARLTMMEAWKVQQEVEMKRGLDRCRTTIR